MQDSAPVGGDSSDCGSSSSARRVRQYAALALAGALLMSSCTESDGAVDENNAAAGSSSGASVSAPTQSGSMAAESSDGMPDSDNQSTGDDHLAGDDQLTGDTAASTETSGGASDMTSTAADTTSAGESSATSMNGNDAPTGADDPTGDSNSTDASSSTDMTATDDDNPGPGIEDAADDSIANSNDDDIAGADDGANNGMNPGDADAGAGAEEQMDAASETREFPEVMIFLLLGQSNMAGQPEPEAEDRSEDPRIRVLAFDNCPNLGREYDEWYTAAPPLHNCDGGVGPGDWFAKTLLPHLPAETSIGLVPLAINGAPIEVFRKGVPRPGWTLPPDDHWPTGYEWIISRATLAQEVGVISGILFHQGESDATNAEWPAQVAQLVSDLRSDLGIGEAAPFVAGHLLETGCCADRNALIDQFPDQIPNAWVASSSGLAGYDVYHFDLPGQRELGKRYAEAMRSALGL